MLTPYWLRPLELGADHPGGALGVEVPGRTQRLIGGIVGAATSRDLAERLGFLQNAMGAVLGPQDAWLVLRGLKTLALRLERQQHNALIVADWLRRQPRVTRVAYPGLPDDPGRVPLARTAGGAGAVLAFELEEEAAVRRLIERLSLIAYAESFGGVESLITVPAVQTHANPSAAAARPSPTPSAALGRDRVGRRPRLRPRPRARCDAGARLDLPPPPPSDGGDAQRRRRTAVP